MTSSLPTGAEPVDLKRAFDKALGGGRGVAESGVPGAVFVGVYALAGMSPALWAAVAVAGLLALGRLVARQTVQHALAGLVGVVICAFVAQRTGSAENFFLPGLFINGGYAAAYLVSIAVRWPLIGVLLGAVLGEGTSWRRDPARRRVYTLATWLWAGMFLLRLAVQLPLYLADAVVPLGVARVAMGWPAWAVCAWVTFLLVRRLPAASGQASLPPSSAES